MGSFLGVSLILRSTVCLLSYGGDLGRCCPRDITVRFSGDSCPEDCKLPGLMAMLCYPYKFINWECEVKEIRHL